ncbi:hypothetical protein G6L99_31910 [Agrobacterium rhizogenes]|uniref:SphA family protein n=1 Tax=Rhizobium rhizogenes TaxID=359 RepID=UPI00157308E0|nr:transporter [Rhizobium rhizogenes]NTH16721.1 hypothetical protein [Rhizobium rhizogenes]
MKRKLSKVISGFAVGTAFLTVLSAGSQAAETIKPAGPIGGTDIRQAFLPPPGLYGVGVGVGLALPKFLTPNGDLDSNGGSGVGGGGLLYVYDAQVFGGSLASSVFASYERTCFGIKPGPESCSSGLGDVYSDVLMWSRFFPSSDFSKQPSGGVPIPYGLTMLIGLGANFPTGNYDSSRMINNGANFFDIAPNLALTYTTKSIFGDALGQATEFSGRVFLNNYTKNPDTDYQTGRIANMDFSITQRMNQWQFGLAGTGFVQFEDDEIGGQKAPNDGNRASGLSLGPVISYDFMWNDRPWNATVKALFGVAGNNTANADGIVLRLGTKLF